MSKPVPKGTKPRETTLLFRIFKRDNAVLSTQYWTGELARHALRESLKAADGEASASKVLSAPFNHGQFDESVKDLLNRLDDRAGMERLNLLVLCTAQLEAFLQDAASLYVAHLGYRREDHHLNEVGRAMAHRIVDRSSVPEMLEFGQQLFGVRFAEHLTAWKRGYKLRCAAAHEAGRMSAETAQKLGDNRTDVGAWIKLPWSELQKYLVHAFKCADMIDGAIAHSKLLDYEVEWTLARWKREGRLPLQKDIWTVLGGLGVELSASRRDCLARQVYK